MLWKSFFALFALSGLCVQAEVIGRAEVVSKRASCNPKALYPMVTKDPRGDVMLADYYVGLSPAVKATLLMITRLNPEFLYAGSSNDGLIVDECTPNGMKSLQSLALYGDPKYCSIQFDFIFNKASFKTPTDTVPFGILPLIVEAAFKALPKLPGTSMQWSNGYNIADIAADIQKLLALVTPLVIQRHPISEILANDPTSTDFRAILDSAEKSPVFMVNTNGVHIVTSKGTDGWKGYDVKNLAKILTWTESDLKSEPLPASLIYNAEHKAISKQDAISCTKEKTFPATS